MIVNKYGNGGGGSASGVTPEQVQQEIQSALTPYWESGITKEYVDSADTIVYASATSRMDDVEEIVSSALNEFHTQILEVSAATSGKADKANVTPNDYMRFPKWNEQGVITGTTGNNLNIITTFMNGTPYKLVQDRTSSDIPAWYAPTRSGTAGDILVSGGLNHAPVWSSVTMPDMAAYTPTSGFSTINGSAITNGGNLVIQGGGGSNSNILAAISSQTEYEEISGSVKTGDLIQVWDVDINGDEETEYGLFQASNVHEGVIDWERRDSYDSLLWAEKDYPWLTENEVYPVDFGSGSFLISLAEGGYNGIGFDGEGKAVITHIVPEEDEQTGEITGMTMEDRDILGELDTLDEVVSQALLDLKWALEEKVQSLDVKNIEKLTQAEYDELVDKDPYTFYIIVNSN